MKSHLGHLQINIDVTNLNFYKDLMTFLGWSVIFENEGMAGFTSGKEGSIWFLKSNHLDIMDHDHVGMNHIGINVESKEDVDATVKFLQEKQIDSLFETPRHRPDFAMSEKDTYYQVMFESPDKVLFEVVYTGPKQ